MRYDDYSHNRRQTEYNQVYLNCWGAKEEKNFLNYTNGHKYSCAKSDLKEWHESCRWLCATGWRGVQEWLEFYSNAGRDEVLMMLLGRNAKCVWAVLTSNSIENSKYSTSVQSCKIALRNKVCVFCELCGKYLCRFVRFVGLILLPLQGDLFGWALLPRALPRAAVFNPYRVFR